MAAKLNANPFDALALSGAAKTKMKSVKNIADVLADMMQDMHGGNWISVIDHDLGFVLVRPNYCEAKPVRGGVI